MYDHIGLRVRDMDASRRFYTATLAPLGFVPGSSGDGYDNGKPGPRPDYGPTYYAAFLIDLDGNNVEAVCFK